MRRNFIQEYGRLRVYVPMTATRRMPPSSDTIDFWQLWNSNHLSFLLEQCYHTRDSFIFFCLVGRGDIHHGFQQLHSRSSGCPPGFFHSISGTFEFPIRNTSDSDHRWRSVVEILRSETTNVPIVSVWNTASLPHKSWRPRGYTSLKSNIRIRGFRCNSNSLKSTNFNFAVVSGPGRRSLAEAAFDSILSLPSNDDTVCQIVDR